MTAKRRGRPAPSGTALRLALFSFPARVRRAGNRVGSHIGLAKFYEISNSVMGVTGCDFAPLDNPLRLPTRRIRIAKSRFYPPAPSPPTLKNVRVQQCCFPQKIHTHLPHVISHILPSTARYHDIIRVGWF